jgi:hypothetical protein
MIFVGVRENSLIDFQICIFHEEEVCNEILILNNILTFYRMLECFVSHKNRKFKSSFHFVSPFKFLIIIIDRCFKSLH